MSKEILFGDGKSKTVPDHVNNFEDVAKKLPDDLKYTPESVQEDKSLRDQLPTPTDRDWETVLDLPSPNRISLLIFFYLT